MPEYDPRIDAPQGVCSEHVGKRWKERFDPALTLEEAGRIAAETYEKSTYLLTAMDYKGDWMYYYIYVLPSGRGVMFVQDPRNLRVVTLYEASYGFGSRADYELFQVLLQEYYEAKAAYEQVAVAVEPHLAKLQMELSNVEKQLEAVMATKARIEAEIQMTQLQKEEADKALQTTAHRITHTIEYNVEVLASKNRRP
jgi:hypothetical protein